ncbi:uncharacterized protein LOC123268087 [Cotesia glomerata]|uniref:uncharacterized protein LOC123268087 n=1 Tax=Cotesia glomerata TaxID=32391 RepID=UPI001D009A6D|nr:uncharacterized protein LOC123268087 [Cotesia glomerata]
MANFWNWSFVFSVTVILDLKISSVIPHQFITISRGDPNITQPGTFEFFNSIHGIVINEENLNDEKFCTGSCDHFDTENRNRSSFLSYPNDCNGRLHSCWLYEKTQKRKDAYTNHYLIAISMGNRYNGFLEQNIAKSYNTFIHTGNICGCLCERSSNDNFTPRGKLLDSFCLDPVVAYEGRAVTGARFKRYDNRIHLQLQQGILVNGTIDPTTVKWKVKSSCKNAQKVVYNFKNGQYEGLKIILEDIILKEKTVVTGALFGFAVYGLDIDEYGNINRKKKTKIGFNQCDHFSRTTDILRQRQSLVPPTSSVASNIESKGPCSYHVLFGGTSFEMDKIQHIVPFIDMQEVVTQPPKPIHGIGWFHKGYPGTSGYLSLKVFVEED